MCSMCGRLVENGGARRRAGVLPADFGSFFCDLSTVHSSSDNYRRGAGCRTGVSLFFRSIRSCLFHAPLCDNSDTCSKIKCNQLVLVFLRTLPCDNSDTRDTE